MASIPFNALSSNASAECLHPFALILHIYIISCSGIGSVYGLYGIITD